MSLKVHWSCFSLFSTQTPKAAIFCEQLGSNIGVQQKPASFSEKRVSPFRTLPLAVLAFAVSIVAPTAPSSRAQDLPKQDRSPRAEQRSAQRPAIVQYFSTQLDDPRSITKVPLDPQLAKLAKGLEPRNKQELISLQKQQSEVAKRLPQVTVNLQHGNTQGSGVIVSPDGFILTAAHVAGKPKQKINIILHDGTRVEGISLGLNRNEDAGVVQITSPVRDPNTNPWPHACLGKASDIQNGAWVIATGHPGGWMPDRPAVIRVGRLLKNIDSTLITDCALIGGDSGGPLFDLEGRLIGIHSRIGVDVDENMHVPTDVFYKSHERLIKSEAWGSLPGFKPYIGVAGAREQESGGRCLIAEVTPRSPAERAGIQPGDIIVRFDGQPIQEFQELKDSVDAMVPGDSVPIEIERDGKRQTLRVIIGSRNS